MEDFKVLKIFLFSIINLLAYLLSIYFYTSLYTKSIIYSSSFKDILNSHLNQVKISFAFHSIFFIIFIIFLFIIIYRSDLSSESSDKIMPNESSNSDCNKITDIALLILFGLCQLFYLLNMLFITISLGRILAIKIENLDDEGKIKDNYIKRISRELVSVGYIFFFILLALFIWALLINDKKLNCIPYIKKKFKSFEDYLKNKIEDTPEKLNNKIKILDEGLKRLKNENIDTISEMVPIPFH